MKSKKVSWFAPATVANVACGFDAMGFAIEQLGDIVIAEWSNNSVVSISAIHNDNDKLPIEISKNTAGVAVQTLLSHVNEKRGVTLEIFKKMPLASGMGSSAASASAAVAAVNELLGSPFTAEDLVAFAMQGETVASGVAHADNIAPALMGGFVLIRSYDPLDLISLPVPADLYCIILHPNIEIRTCDSRGLLPTEISVKKALQQVGNMGALVAGLTQNDYSLISRSLVDVIAEPHRAKLIPGFYDIQKIAKKMGALGCSISGSGPSVFALCEGEKSIEKIGEAMLEECQENGISGTVYYTKINPTGAVKIS